MLPRGVRPISSFFFADRTGHRVHVTARVSSSLRIVHASWFDKPGAERACHYPLFLSPYAGTDWLHADGAENPLKTSYRKTRATDMGYLKEGFPCFGPDYWPAD
jgi:hypothetical protein